MDEPQPTPERPTACPKGHDLWWFHEHAPRYYALCTNCPTVWHWFEQDEALSACHGFNRAILIQKLRWYGALEGHFPQMSAAQLREARKYLDFFT